jgi:hypothetical protein
LAVHGLPSLDRHIGPDVEALRIKYGVERGGDRLDGGTGLHVRSDRGPALSRAVPRGAGIPQRRSPGAKIEEPGHRNPALRNEVHGAPPQVDRQFQAGR